MPHENKKDVIFLAKKKIIEPIKVKFKNSKGKMIEFDADKITIKKVKVRFKARE